MLKKYSVLDKISFYSFLVTVFLLPFFFLPTFQFSIGVSKGLLLFVGMAISLFFWLFARLVDGKISIPKSLILISLNVLVFIILLSSVFSENRAISLWGQGFEIDSFITILVLAFSLLLGAILFQEKETVSYFYGALLLSFAIVFVFQTLNIFLNLSAKFPSFFANVSGANLVGSLNDMAIFAGLGVIIALALLEFFEISRLWKIILFLFLILSLFILALVNFGATWIIVGIFSLILFVFKLSFGVSKSSKDVGTRSSNGRWPIFSFAIIFISLLFIITQSNFIASYFNVSNLDVRPSVSSTLEITKNTLSNDPIFGVGPNRFVNSWLMFKSSEINKTIFSDTNFNFGFGLIPTFLATTGVLGGLGWLFFLAAFVLLCVKALKSMSKNGFVNFLTIIIPIISSAYLWIFSIIYVPSISVFVLGFITTGVLIGFLVSVKGIPLYNIFFLKDPRLSFFAILILMVLMAGTVFFAYKTTRKFTSIVYFGQANKMLAKRGADAIDKAEGKILAASKLNQNDLFFRSLSELYLYKLNSNLNQTSLSEQNKADLQVFLTNAEQSARKAIEFDKTNYTNWLNLGLVYESIVPLGVEKSYENALSAYKEALALNPKSPSTYLRLARLEVAAKNLELAQTYVNNALNEKPNYIDAIIFKAQIDFSMGNKEQTRQDLEMALAIDPNNQNAKSLLENLNKSPEISPEVLPEVSPNDQQPTTND